MTQAANIWRLTSSQDARARPARLAATQEKHGLHCFESQ